MMYRLHKCCPKLTDGIINIYGYPGFQRLIKLRPLPFVTKISIIKLYLLITHRNLIVYLQYKTRGYVVCDVEVRVSIGDERKLAVVRNTDDTEAIRKDKNV